MEPEAMDIYIGDRLPHFQAAAACLGVGPKLRQAGHFCIIVGVLAGIMLLTRQVPATSPVLWAYLVLLGFGIYLCLPDPQPWALPAAGLVIFAVLAESIYFDYEMWRRFHVMTQGNGIGIIIELLLGITLVGSYVSYKRNLSATDAETLTELRRLAIGVNRADLDQAPRILELTRRNNRVRLRRLDGLLLLVTRHYIAFGMYSKLDSVAILKPEMLAFTVLGRPKPGRAVKIRLSAEGMKTSVMKLKPQYLARIPGLGIATTGLP